MHTNSSLFLFFIFSLLSTGTLIGQNQQENFNQILNNNWQFREANTKKWMPVKIPGAAHTGLLENKKIDDPFYRDNEQKLQWIEEKDWEFKTAFFISKTQLAAEDIKLTFHGLDTYADIYVNGKKMLYVNNMFRSWEINIKNQVQEGKNEIRIYFYSAVKKTNAAQEALGYELPGGPRVMARKAQFHFGWDWGPRLCGVGIWRPVILQFSNQARINNCKLPYSILENKKVVIKPVIEIEAFAASEATLHFKIAEKEVQKKIVLKPGKNIFNLAHEIPEAQLWWPNGMGKAHLYDAAFTLKIDNKTIDTHRKKTGFRTVELITQKEGKGKSFYFKINGEPVFMKGANYIPQDIFQNRVTETHYQNIIKDALDANMNMLRVWGGGIYENDIFYELCDANGIMVWQDFMFACAMYPGDEAFLENVAVEAKENVARLSHHPAIALWCGNNENSEGWHRWGWQNNFSKKQRARIWGDYQKLFQEMLPDIVKSITPEIPYWESSPQFGRGNPQHQFEGDAHYWGVWHDAEPFEMFEKKVPRFMSEYGFQSFPSETTINSFTLPEDRSPDSEIMLVHQKHPRGNKLIWEYMKREYPEPEDFASFIYMSQLLQAEGIRKGIDAHRRSRPYCMGTLYWQMNDCWPVASWSSMDYYGNKKALHYFVKKAYADVVVIPVIEKDSIKVFVVSDNKMLTKEKLSLRLMGFSGEVLHKKSIVIDIKKGTSQLVLQEAVSDWLQGRDKKTVFLNCKFEDTDKWPERNAYVEIPKLLNLPDPEIRKNIQKVPSGYEVTIASDVFIRGLYLSTDMPGQFDDNFVDIMPGEVKVLYFKTEEIIEDFGETLTLKYLNTM